MMQDPERIDQILEYFKKLERLCQTTDYAS